MKDTETGAEWGPLPDLAAIVLTFLPHARFQENWSKIRRFSRSLRDTHRGFCGGRGDTPASVLALDPGIKIK